MKYENVYVLYMGKYSDQIGPPHSMRELSALLRQNHSVLISKNLRQKSNSTPIVSGVPESNRGTNLRSALLWIKRVPYFSLLLSFFNLVLFNLKAAYITIFRSDTLLIITQPFLLWPLSGKSNIVYIRRASVPLTETIGIDPVKRCFEQGFRKFPSSRTVYLTDFPEREPDSWVIPNFIDISKPASGFADDRRKTPEIFVTGTFSYRKGGDRVLELSSRMSKIIPINIFGSLTEEYKDVRKPNGLIIHGSVPLPYKNYQPGDIFLSLSRLEGFQRSMVEAMLAGCIVIATDRPDSRSVSESEGVFLVSDKASNQRLVEHVESIVRDIIALSRSERVKLGKSNEILAAERFSRDAIVGRWDDLICSLRG